MQKPRLNAFRLWVAGSPDMPVWRVVITVDLLVFIVNCEMATIETPCRRVLIESASYLIAYVDDSPLRPCWLRQAIAAGSK